MTDDAIRPELVDAEVADADGDKGEAVLEPTKLIRIASMTRALLDEARQADLDEAGRERLSEVHQRSLDQMEGVLSDDLLTEFKTIFEPMEGAGVPSESEIRIAQAQLIGWLEGLFHGIQASLMSQQMAAKAQLAEMQRRSLGQGAQNPEQPTGLYL
jgi:hypothetical protein